MPSNAYSKFNKHLMKDVRALIKSHADLNSGTRGRKHLGHLTRGACVFLCAAWERYVEDVLCESVCFMCENVPDHNCLPEPVRRYISGRVKEEKHELSAFTLAGDGWKTTLLQYAQEAVDAFNTPKKDNLVKLFRRFLGVDDVSTFWVDGSGTAEIDAARVAIDAFVTARGDIAHNGTDAQYPRIKKIDEEYVPLVIATTRTMDNQLNDYLHGITSKRPWRRMTN